MTERDYSAFYDKRGGTYKAAPDLVMRTRETRAGDSIEIEIYPVIRMPPGARREKKRRESSPAQAKRNAMHAEKRIRHLLEANFTAGDFVLHLTHGPGAIDYGRVNMKDVAQTMEDAGAPWDIDAVRQTLRNYIKKIRRRMHSMGIKPARGLKYLYVIETGREARDTDPAPLPPRFHIHMAIHAEGMSRETLESMWPHGYANCDRLNLANNGLEALAHYMAKQFARAERTPGDSICRRWAHSQNLKQPVVTISDSKMRGRLAERIARDPLGDGRAKLEGIFKGYTCVKPPEVYYSDFLPGAYIYARLRKNPTAQRPPMDRRHVPRQRPAAAACPGRC